MSADWNHLIEKIPQLLAPSMAKDHPNLPVVKEEGVYYYGLDGKKYLDYTSGIAVTNVGHRHPNIVQAIKDGADQLAHGPIGVIQYESILKYAEELGKIMPGNLDCFFFGNSGTEAVEGALKLARHVKERPYVISFTGCFHGRTVGSMSISTSKSKYRKWQPVGSSYQVRYYDPKDTTQTALEKLDNDFTELFQHQVTSEEVAAVILEPVLGEGGYIIPPKEWIQSIRKICDDNDLLLIFDEVQTGFGRTGEWFASDVFDVVPDIMAIAKAMASGQPISATVANHELMQQWPLGSHATTYGGNPIACSAGLATIQTIKEENLLYNARITGEYAKEQLQKIKEEFPRLGSIRALGLMIGIEVIDPSTGQADGEAAMKILDLALEEGVLFYFCGNKGEVIRMIPPLTISKEQIDDGLEMLQRALVRLENE